MLFLSIPQGDREDGGPGAGSGVAADVAPQVKGVCFPACLCCVVRAVRNAPFVMWSHHHHRQQHHHQQQQQKHQPQQHQRVPSFRKCLKIESIRLAPADMR